MNQITVTLDNGNSQQLATGTALNTLLDQAETKALPYIGALVNNDAVSLSYPLSVNSEIKFLTMADVHGWRIYRSSLCFLLSKTVRELYPKAEFSIDHSFGQGLYCSFHPNADTNEGISPEQLKELEDAMRKTVEQDLPIERRKIAYTDAVKAFEESGQTNKLNLLKHRNPPRVVLHWCDGYSDLAHGPLSDSTGILKQFELLPYSPGFVINMPCRDNPQTIPEFVDQPHLFSIFQEHKEWGKVLQVDTVGRLNEIVAEGKIEDFIRSAEALHEKKLTHIADDICKKSEGVKLILIAGPSCAGKTTFAKKLSNHLQANGIKPVTVSTDNYFVGEERNPVCPDGSPDYEHIEAVDLELFNEDLLKLVEGKETRIPIFNFALKKREYKNDAIRIKDKEVIIIEGIHGLNPRLTEAIPADCEYRIYVSALTQLSVDRNNRISTTDNRLMRRLIRDHKYRGHNALDTLKLWPSVRRGEKEWIFPFQRAANATFNSALDYELAVLKPLVEPLLMQIKPTDSEYALSRRLTEFLLNFLGSTDDHVPEDSILREYIGGSTYNY